MSRQMWIGAAAAWVAVVTAGSGVTWIAIERAGDQVTATPDAAEATRPPVVGTLGPAPSLGPTTRSGATSASRPSPVPTTPAATRSAEAIATATQRPAPTSPRPPSQPAPRTEIRSWSGVPGSLTVACTGSQVSFRSATPSDGWTFERGDASGENIEVTFKSSTSEVQVRATCSGGVPQFRVQSEAGDGE
jgi:hypothetical protein